MTLIEYIVYGILTVISAAFLFCVFFGKPSKDEPLRPPVEEHEMFWRK